MTDRMILGEDAIFSTDSNLTGINNNAIIVGSSGSGKTMSYIEPRLLDTEKSSLVVTLTKRRLVQKYKAMFKAKGYKVYDLDFVHPASADIAYDPLAYVTSYADVRFLADSIVKANPRKDQSHADPYWDESASSLLCALIFYTLTTKEDPTFADVLELNDRITLKGGSDMDGYSLDSEFDALERKVPNHPAVTCWKTFRATPPRTAGCIFSSLNCELDSIFTSDIREMIAKKPTVDIERIAKEKSVLFITSSPVNPSLHQFIGAFYSCLFKTLFEFAEECPDGKLPIPVHVLCDDFATGCRVNQFEDLISIFREKQISATILVQSESQLETMYGSDATTTIINNSDTYVYVGGNDLRTARNISERLNVPLDEVLYMPVGQAIIFRRGQKPIAFRHRYDILHDKRYQKITKQYEKMIVSDDDR